MRLGWRVKILPGVRIGNRGVRLGPRAVGLRASAKSVGCGSVAGRAIGRWPYRRLQPISHRQFGFGDGPSIGAAPFAFPLITTKLRRIVFIQPCRSVCKQRRR